MITVLNPFIPFKGFKVLTFWPFLFIRKGSSPMTDANLNHERIHARQQIEMLLLPFYLWYGIEYLVRLVQHRFKSKEAYFAISLEREAYQNQDDPSYLDRRQAYCWLSLL